MTASSRITVRDGSAVTARSIPEQSRIGETWFEMPGEAPEAAMSGNAGVVVSAMRGCAALELGQAFAIRCCFPFGQRLDGTLRGIVQVVRCGGSEYCVFTSGTMERFIAKDWAEAVTEVVRHCFTSEKGYQVFDRGNAPLIAWYLSALRARRMPYRLSYDALQSTSWVYVNSVADTLPPIARGGCACIGAVNKPTVQLTWTAAEPESCRPGVFSCGIALHRGIAGPNRTAAHERPLAPQPTRSEPQRLVPRPRPHLDHHARSSRVSRALPDPQEAPRGSGGRGLAESIGCSFGGSVAGIYDILTYFIRGRGIGRGEGVFRLRGSALDP